MKRNTADGLFTKPTLLSMLHSTTASGECFMINQRLERCFSACPMIEGRLAVSEEVERSHRACASTPSANLFPLLPPEDNNHKWFDFHLRTRLSSSQSIKGRLCWRSGFVLGEEPFVKSGNLEFGTMRISLKGGCHYDQWNCEVV